MIAYCGLNCSDCGALLATKENDDTLREKTAKTWSKLFNAEIKPERINCEGCKSGGVKFFHCSACEIRNCCVEKGHDHCAGCSDYICDQLAAFIKMAPEAGRALETIR